MNPVLFSRATIRFLRVDDTVASTHNLYAPIETKQRVTRSKKRGRVPRGSSKADVVLVNTRFNVNPDVEIRDTRVIVIVTFLHARNPTRNWAIEKLFASGRTKGPKVGWPLRPLLAS